MQKFYENFLHENFYTRSNYYNRTVIYVNYMKIFLHENFYHENYLHKNKANYGTLWYLMLLVAYFQHSAIDLGDCMVNPV